MPPPFSPREPSSSPAADGLREAKRARGRAASRGESLVADECRGPRHRQPPCWCRPAHRTPRRVHQTVPRREAGHARLLTPPRPPGATACWPSKRGLRAARCRGRISHTPGCLSQKATFVSGRTDPRGPSVRTVAKSPSRGASGSALGQGGGGATDGPVWRCSTVGPHAYACARVARHMRAWPLARRASRRLPERGPERGLPDGVDSASTEA